MAIKEVIGDYDLFFAGVEDGLRKLGVDTSGMALSHLNYRVETQADYEHLRDLLKTECSGFVETQFNGRAVSILVLAKPLVLKDDRRVDVIELPAPRSQHMYPTGLEHVGYVADSLEKFKRQYRNVITGEKDRRPYSVPAFITLAGGASAKFYEYGLQELVRHQGWTIESLCEGA